jgi:hypothetical protein
MIPNLALPWHPSRGEMILVAFAPWIVLYLILAISLKPLRAYSVRQSWENQPAFQRHVTWEMTDDCVRISDAITDSRMTWAYFTRVRESENLLLVTREDGAFYILPKRVFPGAVELDQARALLSTKIKDCALLPSMAAFPVLDPKPVLPLETPPG